ncbi:hypothetical protein [Actinoplanes rectilineatus]|uniref:hypothetical protein n=1 Tax=Actinoplanes rectilineatus TaxID=113571 RepID=UPI0005F29AC6|nr:hypothetical protein [Actinoplanes rectilineatus]
MTLDLVAVQARAAEAYRWADYQSLAVPAAVREHFNSDAPALIAEIERLHAWAGRLADGLADLQDERDRLRRVETAVRAIESADDPHDADTARIELRAAMEAAR